MIITFGMDKSPVFTISSISFTNMKILMVIKTLGSGSGGGAERMVAQISGGLANRNHEVSVLTFDPPGSSDFYPIIDKVRRIRTGIGEAHKKSTITTAIRRIMKIRHISNVIEPDVVVAFMNSSFVLSSFALFGSRCNVIACERISYKYYADRSFQNVLLHAAFLLPDEITVNSESSFYSYPGYIRRRMRVIPNPVAAASAVSDPIGGSFKTMLTVGSLRSQKDHSALIRAFALIAPQYPDWRLRIVGDGSLRSDLQELISNLKLQCQVELVRAKTCVEEEYRAAQIFVLPSQFEGFPNALAEALAHGLPSVGFADCPGTIDLIRPGVNGFLAGGGDRIASLAGAMAMLMSSPETRVRFARAAIESVAHYSLETILNQWEALLHSNEATNHVDLPK